MEKEMANLNLSDEEEEAFREEAVMVDTSFQLCLVGRCLTDSVVHFPSLRNTLADLWHNIRGICISDLGEKRILFQFFHEVDILRVLAGTPWFFNNYLLVLHRIQPGEIPSLVPLNWIEFWVQVHDLPSGLITEHTAKQFVPLKWKKKILIGNDRTIYAKFRYEKLSLFCFICGKLGYGESFCNYRIMVVPSKIVYGWDISLQAAVRMNTGSVNRWLREADGSDSILLSKEREVRGQKLGNMRDYERNYEAELVQRFSNPILMSTGSDLQAHNKGLPN
ncbi:hypothetical protein J1N35_009900 [Gossypium stocksii]|uniref:DUF4283 domain-containing protein n=1 Tax=Gossypium stocksii TaxID=47602 RepID=A0A9D3VZZ0_9ROSI|nr:hypothetical protein J1N35_009900 [Gossypium stocksii]